MPIRYSEIIFSMTVYIFFITVYFAEEKHVEKLLWEKENKFTVVVPETTNYVIYKNLAFFYIHYTFSIFSKTMFNYLHCMCDVRSITDDSHQLCLMSYLRLLEEKKNKL